MRLLTARWVYPVSSPPIADGAVLIQAGGIMAVGPWGDLAAASGVSDRWDLGEAVLLPGLVNCHTHLELPAFDLPVGNGAFSDWLVGLIEQRRRLSPDVQTAAAEVSVEHLLRAGTTCVGEVSTTGQSARPLQRRGLRGVLYREVLGLSPQEAEARRDAARIDLQALQRTLRGGLLGVGLSPHSPYALSEELFAACETLRSESGIPWCIHVAESREEVEFLRTGTGPIPQRLYPAVGCSHPPRRRHAESPIAYLEALGVLLRRPLLIHAVHVTAADVRLMATRGVGVAHCPRSNARLSGGVAPVPEFLRYGIPVGLGTDSLASVPTLSLWDEMRAALERHAGGLTPAQVLEMATLGGARALGLADRVGSLVPGRRADLIAVAAGTVRAADPVGSLIATAREGDVLWTMVEGEIRSFQGQEPSCE